MLKIGIDEETFNEFLYFLELFTTGNYIVQTQRNYSVGTKGLCKLPQISLIKFLVFFQFHLVFIPFDIDFSSYGFYRGIFAPIAPNESCSICSGVLVDFKFGIDFEGNWVNMQFYGFSTADRH